MSGFQKGAYAVKIGKDSFYNAKNEQEVQKVTTIIHNLQANAVAQETFHKMASLQDSSLDLETKEYRHNAMVHNAEEGFRAHVDDNIGAYRQGIDSYLTEAQLTAQHEGISEDKFYENMAEKTAQIEQSYAFPEELKQEVNKDNLYDMEEARAMKAALVKAHENRHAELEEPEQEQEHDLGIALA